MEGKGWEEIHTSYRPSSIIAMIVWSDFAPSIVLNCVLIVFNAELYFEVAFARIFDAPQK